MCILSTGYLDWNGVKWLEKGYTMKKVEDTDMISFLYEWFEVHCTAVIGGC
jgi:hypothetical protein